MCGLVGYLIPNEDHFDEAVKTLKRLMIASQERGEDASGIAFIGKDKKLHHLKDCVPAGKLIEQKTFDKILEEHKPLIVIGHTRAKTQGDQKDNFNNHPIITKSGLALVHNGMITNDAEPFSKYGLKRDGEVDSEAIVKLIEHYLEQGKMTEAIQKTTKELRGSMACALISTKQPKSLYLWNSTNPLVVVYNKKTGGVYFASKKDFIIQSMTDYVYHMGFFRETTNPGQLIIWDSEHNDDTLLRLTPRMVNKYSITRPAWATYQPAQSRIPAKSDYRKSMFDYWGKGGAKYNGTGAIERPSEYSDGNLFQRLNVLDQALTNYSIRTDLTNPEKQVVARFEKEQQRIEDMLVMRLQCDITSGATTLDQAAEDDDWIMIADLYLKRKDSKVLMT